MKFEQESIMLMPVILASARHVLACTGTAPLGCSVEVGGRSQTLDAQAAESVIHPCYGPSNGFAVGMMPRKQFPHIRHLPRAAAPGEDAAGIWFGGNGPQACRPGRLDVLDDFDQIGGVRVGIAADAALAWTHIAVTTRHHVFRHDRGSGRGSGNMYACGIAAADFLRHKGAAKDGRKPQLVAAGQEYPGGTIQHFGIFRVLAVGRKARQTCAGYAAR